ncbi:MAG: hypothetical protein COT85_06210 [Chlamydiae bacterium CG10_big_fil_rev_8_21_14_0_10_42_34]|nr:MAG: hypothetical protein COT85_06210 [Chlamydiae bacterium CG10_big_fil_rev_8_21_14_0_10_42_34]
MKPARIQLLMVVGVIAITLHFTIRFGTQFYEYSALQKNTIAKILQWEVLEVNDRFALKASYEFATQGKSWKGDFTLSPPYYLNELSAIASLKSKAKESWTVWYNPKNPHFSALEKKFPLSYLVRSIICFGVLIYFFSLYKRVVLV